jgi:two-component system response regulator BaeR
MGQALDLTPLEFRLLCTLAQAPGRVLSRSQLIDRLHEDQRAISDRAIDSHIKNLRRKLAPVTPGTELIGSIYGVGYKFEGAQVRCVTG